MLLLLFDLSTEGSVFEPEDLVRDGCDFRRRLDFSCRLLSMRLNLISTDGDGGKEMSEEYEEEEREVEEEDLEMAELSGALIRLCLPIVWSARRTRLEREDN